MIPMGNIPPHVVAMGKVFNFIGKVFAFLSKPAVQLGLFVAQGVMAHKAAMEAKRTGADILLQKYGTGEGMPVIYGTRRVAGTVVYMNTTNNKELFVVYAIAGHEIDSFDMESLQIDGRTIKDTKIYRQGYDISDGTNRIAFRPSGETRTSGTFWGNTSTERANITGGANTGDNARMTFNLHKGTNAQAADPMLSGIISEWTSDHKLSGIAYIAANYEYDTQGMFTGIPNLTLVVNGKKVYDPRTTNTTFSSNPALCLLDYLTNDEYGKGLSLTNDIDTSSFSTAANDCDVSADTITHSSIVVERASTTTDRLTIANANEDDYNNFKVGNKFTISDGVTTYVNSKKLIDKDFTLIDIDGSNPVATLQLKFEDGAVGTAITSNTTCTFTETQIRFDCNGVLDTDETVLENTKLLVANMRGIFTYAAGKYSVKVEGTESSVVTLDEDDILESGITLSLENKEAKYNKVEAEFYNAQKKYETDTTYYTGETSDTFLSDDGNEILETRIQLPFCTNQRIAYNHAKAMLKRSRSQKTISFVATPKVLKAKVGEVISITNSNLNLSSEQYRITNMVINPDLNISVNAIEYQTAIYGYVTPPNEEIGIGQDPVDGYRVEAPSSLTFTNKNATTGEPAKLTWTDSSKYPSYEFRVQIIDGVKTRYDKRVKDTTFYLDGISIANGYLAKVSAINALGIESDTTNLTVNVTTAPITTVDIGQGSIGGFSFDATKMYHGTGTFNNTNTAVYFDNTGQFSLKDKLSWNGTTLNISGNLTVENTITADKIILDGQALNTLMSSTGAGSTTIDELTVSNDCFLEGGFSISASHDGLFADNSKAIFGAGSDLKIYHDGSNSYIQDSGTGNLRISGTQVDILNPDANEFKARFKTDGAVELYYDNSKTFETISGGVAITGNATTTGSTPTHTLQDSDGTNQLSTLKQDGGSFILTARNNTSNGNIIFKGNNGSSVSEYARFNSSGNFSTQGNITVGGDLTVNGTTTTLNTATLDVEDKNITLNYSTGDSSSAADGAGITIQDAVSATTDATILWDATNDKFDFSHSIQVPDNANVKVGSAGDLFMVHNGSNSFIQNKVGDFYIENAADDKDILFRSDDGSGGLATYMTIDGSHSRISVAKEFIALDNVPIRVGSGGDAEFKHDASNTYLINKVGDFYIQNTADDKDIIFQSDDGSGGVTSYFLLDGSNAKTQFNRHLKIIDNMQIQVGTSPDMLLYHDGSNSYIDNSTGDLRIRGAYVKLQGLNGENMLVGNQNGNLELYHDNVRKFKTTTTGGEFEVGDGIVGTLKIQGGNTTVSAVGEVNARLDFGSNDASVNSSGNIGGSIQSITEYNNGAWTGLAFFTFEQGSSGLREVVRMSRQGHLNLKVGDLQINGTSVIDTSRNLTNIGTINSGNITATQLTVDDITINGSTISDSGNFTIDAAEIRLDSDSAGVIRLKDSGTEYGKISQNSNNLRIFSSISDGDILLQGNDGGSTITALTLDMSDAGTASFNHDIKLADNGQAIFGTGSDLKIYHDGSNSYIWENGTGNLILRATDFRLQDSSGNSMAVANSGGGVGLYHNASIKLDTTSSGISVTGAITSSGTITSGSDVIIPDKISHTGDSDTYIQFHGNDLFRVVTGGSERFEISNSGFRFNENSADMDFTIESNNDANMFFVDGGNDKIGIGTSSPATKLEVAGNITLPSDGQIKFRGTNHYPRIFASSNNLLVNVDNGSGTNFTALTIDNGGTTTLKGGTADTSDHALIVRNSSSTALFSIRNDGRIDVGGSQILDISRNMSNIGTISSGAITLTGTGTDNDSHQINFVNGACAIARDNNDLELHAYNAMVFGVSNTSYPTSTERMRIDSSGNVGIGTTSPSRQLTVQNSGNAVAAIVSGTSSLAQLALGDTGDDNYAQILLDNSANKLQIQNGGGGAVSDRGITLDSSENVGIGTASPNYLLDVEGTGSTLARLNSTSGSALFQISVPDTTSICDINFGDTGHTQRGQIRYRHNGDSLAFSTAQTEAIRIDSSQRVGIGTTAPAQKLEVAGRVRATTDPTFEVYESSSLRGGIQWDTSSNFTNIFSVGGDIRFERAGSERGRFTSSGLSVSGAITSTGLVTADELSVTNDSTFNGGLDINGDATFGDNNKAIFGASSDLQIYHSSGNNFINAPVGGNLILQANNVTARSVAQENMISAVANGAVTLYYDNSAKLATTSSGITVTGAIAETTLGTILDTSGNLTNINNVYASGYRIGSTQIVDSSRNLTNIGTYSGGGNLSTTGRITATGGRFQSTTSDNSHREYVITTGSGGGDFFLGQIEYNDAADGAITGCIYFAYDYGTSTESPKIHFSFHQRNGTARGSWWYEHDDDAEGANNVKAVLIDDGSGGMFVWIRVGDYGRVAVVAETRHGGNWASSGSLTAGTITTGTTLFDTSNDPTSEHHIGKLFAHDDVILPDNKQIKFGDGADLQIFHNGTHSYINQSGTGDLFIRNTTDDGDVYIQSDNGSGGITTFLKADGGNGTLQLFHYGSLKASTTSAGISVTGEVNVTGEYEVNGVDVIDASRSLQNITGASFTSGGRDLDIILADSPSTGNVGVQLRAGASDYIGLAGGGGTGIGLVVDSSNRVGIGTTTPASTQKLDVAGKIRASQDITITNGDLIVNTEDKGIRMLSTNGTEFLLTVSDAGALVITEQ